MLRKLMLRQKIGFLIKKTCITTIFFSIFWGEFKIFLNADTMFVKEAHFNKTKISIFKEPRNSPTGPFPGWYFHEEKGLTDILEIDWIFSLIKCICIAFIEIRSEITQHFTLIYQAFLLLLVIEWTSIFSTCIKYLRRGSLLTQSWRSKICQFYFKYNFCSF